MQHQAPYSVRVNNFGKISIDTVTDDGRDITIMASVTAPYVYWRGGEGYVQSATTCACGERVTLHLDTGREMAIPAGAWSMADWSVAA